MRRFVALPIIVLLFGSGLLLSGCTQVSRSGRQANANGFFGIVGLDNSRPRCTFTDEDRLSYRVHCQTVVVTPDGSEVLATSIAPGIELEWLAPIKIEGGEIEVGSCSIAASSLAQECSIKLKSPEAAKVQFDLKAKETATQNERTESDIVQLPFSVESFGRVASLLSYEAQVSKEAQQGRFGLQNPALPATETFVGVPTSVCWRPKRTFFSTEQHVYVLEDGKIRLFAGSSNPANVSDLTHRLRLGFGRIVSLACSDDTVYVADSPDQPNSRVYKVPENGKATELVAPGAITHSINSVAVGADGIVYYNDAHDIYRILPTGESTRISDINTPNFPVGPQAFAVAKDGSLYVAELFRIKRIDKSGAITTIAGTDYNYRPRSGDGGPATQGTFGNIGGLSFSASGDLFILAFDPAGWHIRKINPQGIVSSIANTDSCVGIAAEDSGSVLVANVSKLQIVRIGTNGQATAVAGAQRLSQMVARTEYDPVTAQFGNVSGIAIGRDDTIYIADRSRHQILKIDKTGKTSVYAGTGTSGFSGDSALATSARLNTPSDVLISDDNTLYIADSQNRRIRRIAPDGRIYTHVYAVDLHPQRLAWGPTGTLYFSNDIQWATYTTYSFGYVEGGVARPVFQERYRNSFPGGFAVLSDGKIAFSDGYSGLHVMNPADGTQVPMTLGGEPGFTEDGPAATALFSVPATLSTDESGSLYVADKGNGRIRKVASTAEGYHVSSLLGGASKKDCSGAIIKKNLSSTDWESEIRLSLATVCYSKPVAFAMRNHCNASSDPHITIAISQSFGSTSNVLRIRRPCP